MISQDSVLVEARKERIDLENRCCIVERVSDLDPVFERDVVLIEGTHHLIML